MLSTHMVVIECHRICVCVCVCDYAIAIYLLDSLMRTRSRNSFMQSVPHFAIIGSYCYIAIEQKYINRKRHTREWAREWERARQLNITYKHIVGNSLVKQTNEVQNAWWLFLLSENVKFNENDLGRERERDGFLDGHRSMAKMARTIQKPPEPTSIPRNWQKKIWNI